MSRNEDIDNAIWSDPEFEPLSEHAALLYIWSFTNPLCGMAGMYQVTPRRMTDSHVPIEEIPGALAELAEARFAFYEDHVLWVRSRVRRLRSKSPPMAIGVVNDLLKTPAKHPLRARFVAEYKNDRWLREELKRTYGEPMGNLSEKPVNKPDSHRFPDTSLEVPGQGEGKEVREKVQLPPELPVELHPHLRSVYRVLNGYAVRHDLKAINPLSLAAVAMARQHRPLVKAACDFVAYAEGQAQPRKDLVAGWRNWLDKENDLAGFERLGPDGMPAGVPHLSAVVGGRSRPGKWTPDAMWHAIHDPAAPADITDAEVVEESA